jgi:hypothetical protein
MGGSSKTLNFLKKPLRMNAERRNKIEKCEMSQVWERSEGLRILQGNHNTYEKNDATHIHP